MSFTIATIQILQEKMLVAVKLPTEQILVILLESKLNEPISCNI